MRGSVSAGFFFAADPAMTKTDIANLALSKIAESLIDDIDDTGDKRARLAKLFYEPALREILRAHFWDFAKTPARLIPLRAAATLNPDGSDNSITITAVNPGKAGMDISIQILGPQNPDSITIAVVDKAITIGPLKDSMMIAGTNAGTYDGLVHDRGTQVNGKRSYSTSGNVALSDGEVYCAWSGVSGWRIGFIASGNPVYFAESGIVDAETPDEVALWTDQVWGSSITMTAATTTTAAEIIAALTADSAAAALVTAIAAGAVTGTISEVPATFLSGLETLSGTRWGQAFPIPSDFIKLKRVSDAEHTELRDGFDVIRHSGARHLVTESADDLVIEYVQFVDDPEDWDPLFVTAFTTLLAARIARSITGSEKAESDLLSLYHNVDLPAARTADAHDTQSGENRLPMEEFVAGSLTGTRGSFFPVDDE